MAGRGGRRPGAGRKSKLEELGIAEKMDKVLGNDEVFKQLAKLVTDGELNAIKLWLEYSVGKPTKEINMNTNLTGLSVPDIDALFKYKQDGKDSEESSKEA